jgi:putative transposase
MASSCYTYIERFNRTFRTEVLERYVFTTLTEVRRMTEDWQHRYNHHRPHRSLGGLSPVRYAMASSVTSISE